MINEKKFRLFDKDRDITQVYTLNELISKTFRRGKFEYRGEFIGLKDKNGKEIYESDIILYDNDKKAKVVWKKGGFVFVYEDNVENILSESWYAPADVKITEVIGNIYENKDLLNN